MGIGSNPPPGSEGAGSHYRQLPIQAPFENCNPIKYRRVGAISPEHVRPCQFTGGEQGGLPPGTGQSKHPQFCGVTSDALSAKAGPTKSLEWVIGKVFSQGGRAAGSSRDHVTYRRLKNFPPKWRMKVQCVLSTSVSEGIG
jgi:hypothetical protein